MGCLLDDLRPFGINLSVSVDNCSPARGGMTQYGGTFHGEIDRCRKRQGAVLRHAVSIVLIVCPTVTGRTKERIVENKRARAG